MTVASKRTTDDIAPHLRYIQEQEDDDTTLQSTIVEDGELSDDENHHAINNNNNLHIDIGLDDISESSSHPRNTKTLVKHHDRESLDPIPVSHQTWRFYHYAAIWVSLSINVSSFMLGPSLVIQAGMTWIQALLCVFFGNVITLLPLILNAYTGVKYGVAFPVVVRKCFGVRGALITASIRGFVGVGWFSFQIYIGGRALFVASTALFPILGSPALYLGDVIGIHFWELFCFLVFLVCNGVAVLSGIEKVKLLQILTAPLLIIAALVLFIWSLSTVGFERILRETSDLRSDESTSRPLGINVMIALSSVVGSWSTMMLNITDFSRYGKSQADQIIGQIIGLPIVITSCAFIGIVATAAGSVKYGGTYWDPVDLFRDFPNKWLSALACVVLACSILAGNITANLVSAANDWVNLYPRLINFRIATVATCIIGLLMVPWKLFGSGHNFVMVWLVGSGGLMGAIGGVLIADFWIVRFIIPPKIPTSLKLDMSSPNTPERAASPVDTSDRPVDLRFNVEHLYLGRDSIYFHTQGFHLKAFFASILSVLPSIPGFLANLGVISTSKLPQWILDIYSTGWFVSVFLSMVLYVLFCVLFHYVYKRLRWKRETVTTDATIKRWKSRDNFMELQSVNQSADRKS